MADGEASGDDRLAWAAGTQRKAAIKAMREMQNVFIGGGLLGERLNEE